MLLFLGISGADVGSLRFKVCFPLQEADRPSAENSASKGVKSLKTGVFRKLGLALGSGGRVS